MIKHRKFEIRGILLFFVFPFLSLNISAQSDIIINEFLAINETVLADEDTEYSDWIEIYNTTGSPVNLQAWSLTDDISIPNKWIFPDQVLNAHSYLVVFTSGKNKRVAGQELHTNFKLDGSGEYLALFNPQLQVSTEFNPSYLPQQNDISYGNLNNTWFYFSSPTPGEGNGSSAMVPAPDFSNKHGIYETPFDLEMTSIVGGTDIYYTTDGSIPSTGNGTLYTTPINISGTSIIRALNLLDEQNSSKVTTQTYLFLEDVIHQSNTPHGYPATWGPYTAISGDAIADYEVDPDLVSNPTFASTLKNALKDIPTMSLVTDKDHLFSKDEDPETGGIYIYTGPPLSSTTRGLGDGWERPVSMEYFDPNDTISLQVDCGIRINGGHSRRPEKSPKHSFRLVFRSEYGPGTLNFPLFGDEASTSFNAIILRADFCNSWVHHSSEERNRAQYTRDAWAKDAQINMGHLNVHGKFVHLYVNGIYWGLYNPNERVDDRFAETYLEGNDVDFDIIKDYTEALDGNLDAWDAMMDQADAGLESNEAYQRIQGNNEDGTPNSSYHKYVDVENIIDYMLINFYGGNTDWDHHNWIAIKNRNNPKEGFHFICWDSEHVVKDLNANLLGEDNANCPSDLFQKLRANEDFRRKMGDQVQKHCFNNGTLTPEVAAALWNMRAVEIEEAVNGESARWGDYRRDVHQYQTSGPFDLYTKQDHWLPVQNWLYDTYFPNRTDVFLDQLRSADLFPNADAPVYLVNGSAVSGNTFIRGDDLSITSSNGTIYFTTDGSDPVISSSGSVKSLTLFSEDVDKKVLVPKSDIGTSWYTDISFDDSGWQESSGSPGGVGYENNSGYETLITLDVGSDMNEGTNPNSSCYIRIPFTVDKSEISDYIAMELGILYDDGFIAYLNGIRVAEQNAPVTPEWNSVSSSGHEAESKEIFTLSEHIDVLVEGNNILAIQGMNTSLTSSDFVISADLKLRTSSGNGDPSETAMVYSDPLEIDESKHIKARTLYNGEWSALNDRFFYLTDDFSNIKITEVHYHPLDEDTINDSEFEFIELKNIGTSNVLLGGAIFIKGLTYEFEHDVDLNGGDFIVLASNSEMFFERYGIYPFDEYEGQLDNGGEWLILADPLGDTLCAFRYNDGTSWPYQADGLGYSLVPEEINPDNDQTLPEYWRSSIFIGGSPGGDDDSTFNIINNDTLFVENQHIGEFLLEQNYPNPFSEYTYIAYELANDARINLSVFNMMGQAITTLVDDYQYSGTHQVQWNGRDMSDSPVNNGIYLYRMTIESNGRIELITKRMLLMR